MGEWWGFSLGSLYSVEIGKLGVDKGVVIWRLEIIIDLKEV